MRPTLKHVVASAFLAVLPGIAAAEITLTGDAYMGIAKQFKVGFGPLDEELQFASRARVRVTMTGETDAGLSFGASFRMDEAQFTEAAAGRPWTTGTVYIAGPFGKLSMGDTDSAAEAAVGHVSGVGMTGLGQNNETTYIQSSYGAALGPSVLYEYYGTGWAVFASATNKTDRFFSQDVRNLSIGGRYAVDNLTLSAGFERVTEAGRPDLTNKVFGIAYEIGDFDLKAIYGRKDETSFLGVYDAEHYYASVDWTSGAFVGTVFYARQPDSGTLSFLRNADYYGVGGVYDLGGGASVVGGVVKQDPAGSTSFTNQTAFDLGLSFAF